MNALARVLGFTEPARTIAAIQADLESLDHEARWSAMLNEVADLRGQVEAQLRQDPRAALALDHVMGMEANIQALKAKRPDLLREIADLEQQASIAHTKLEGLFSSEVREGFARVRELLAAAEAFRAKHAKEFARIHALQAELRERVGAANLQRVAELKRRHQGVETQELAKLRDAYLEATERHNARALAIDNLAKRVGAPPTWLAKGHATTAVTRRADEILQELMSEPVQ